MADNSSIEWTDTTWNVALGCDRVSSGCDGCYAIPQAHIRASNPHPKVAAAFAGLTTRTSDRLDWTGKVNLIEERLNQPFAWRNPRKVFVNSLADLFHDKIPADFISDVFAVMALTPQHTYQILTKRHGPMRSLLNKQAFWYQVGRKARHLGYSNSRAANHLGDGSNIYDTAQWETRRHLPNVWLGVSVEDQKHADLRIPALLETPAAVRWISAEPLLGPVILRDDWMGADPYRRDEPSLTWVVAGGESGPKARPMHPSWPRSLRDQCQAAGIAFLYKQWGEWWPQPRYNTDDRHHVVMVNGMDRGTPWPGWGLDQPDAEVMERVGKKRAGRLLDGREWNEFPQEVAATGAACSEGAL